MSIFQTMTVACPACGKPADYQAVHSVNADRRSDLREAILADAFQSNDCPHCGTNFRLDPEFVYVHAARSQWIGAYPLTKLAQWKELEESTPGLFERTYGAEASPRLQEIGRGMKPRITFGWGGLREKVFLGERGLDDVTIELCKAAVLRGSESSPIDAQSELRLIDASADQLVFGWLRMADQNVGDRVGIERTLYDEIAADTDGDWADLREGITAGWFVDLNRLMLA